MDFHWTIRKEIQELSRRKPCFSDSVRYPSQVITILPVPQLASQYVPINPIDKTIQTDNAYSIHEVNTDNVICESRGVHHFEGGWPRDINPHEPDQVARYRKKIEKDDNFVHNVLQLCSNMEHCIKQNNALDLYEQFFPDEDDDVAANPVLQIQQSILDPSPGLPRAVTDLSWSPDGALRLAAAYSMPTWENYFADRGNDSYIWDIEKPSKPEVILKSPCQIGCLAFNPKDVHCLAGGLVTGRVGIWDGRRGSGPVELSPIGSGHTETVARVMWSNSKAGGEFFSASSDGQVLWWDVRKLVAPVDSLVLYPAVGSETRFDTSLAACSLEYDPSMPTKFLVGTEQGIVLSCNRRARMASERIISQYEAQLGPVRALQRHPQLPKTFLTIGDWTAKVWAEDIKDSPILSLRGGSTRLTDASWSPTRPSLFFTADDEGCVQTWDILIQRSEPILTIKLVDDSLLCLRVQEQGKLLAVGSGSHEGRISLVSVSEALCGVSRNDKTLLTTMFERETRREKMLEAKTKEQRLRDRGKPTSTTQTLAPPTASLTTPGSATEPHFSFAEKITEDGEVFTNGISSTLNDEPESLTMTDEILLAAEKQYFESIQQEIAQRRRGESR